MNEYVAAGRRPNATTNAEKRAEPEKIPLVENERIPLRSGEERLPHPNTMWKRIKLAVSQKLRLVRETVRRMARKNQSPKREVLVNERRERRLFSPVCGVRLNFNQIAQANNVRRPLRNGEEELSNTMWKRIKLAVRQKFRVVPETISRIASRKQTPRREVLVNERPGRRRLSFSEQTAQVNNEPRNTMWKRIKLAVRQKFRLLRETIPRIARGNQTPKREVLVNQRPTPDCGVVLDCECQMPLSPIVRKSMRGRGRIDVQTGSTAVRRLAF